MPEFIFREEDHTYWLDGKSLDYVTGALSLVDKRPKDPWYLNKGKIIHIVTEYYDRDELDEATVDPQIMGYLNSYRLFLQETGFKPTHIELPLYHPQYLYAGKLDRMGNFHNSDLDLVDLKSGVPYPTDKLQGSAYWGLAISNKLPIRKVFDLYLQEDGSMPHLREVEKPRILFNTFLAILTSWRWKEENLK
jgi:hypothetical protein